VVDQLSPKQVKFIGPGHTSKLRSQEENVPFMAKIESEIGKSLRLRRHDQLKSRSESESVNK